jgi:protein-S-isoprenylcysteine O-methyltransferase Ste14
MPGPYRLVRHPLYVGWITMFWATPALSIGHMLFASLMTAYILVAIYFEERNLVGEFGEEYEAYRRTTPMLVPRTHRDVTLAPEELVAGGSDSPLRTVLSSLRAP